MNGRTELAERREQALRDLVELEEQERAGEIPPADAARLRVQYEQEAASAILALTARGGRRQPADPGRPARRVAYVAAIVVAGVAAAILLPVAVVARPPGGYVTGNELNGQRATPSAAPQRDLTKVSDEELEEVVRANPDVVGMRLALADRYFASGRYDRAASHYARVLERQPNEPVATARTGWILFQAGDVERAAQLVARARSADPSLLEAMWFDANIRLYGRRDRAGALRALADMRAAPGIRPTVLDQVAALEAQARAAEPGR